MSFSLTVKSTSKFLKLESYSRSNAWYGSETGGGMDEPRTPELLGSNGLTPRIWDSAQHDDNFLAILETADLINTHKDSSENSRGTTYLTNRKFSLSLHKKRGENYKQILTTKPTSVSQSVSDSKVDDFYFNSDKSFVAAINHPSLNRSEIAKFNKKGKVLWSSNKLPEYAGGSYDITVDQAGNIYVFYYHAVDGPTIAKVNGRNGDVLWSTKTPIEKASDSWNTWESVGAAANSILLVDDASVLVVASGHFPDDYSGTRAFLFNTETGSIIEYQDIDGDSSYDQFELFKQKDIAYLRTTVGVYSLGKVAPDAVIELVRNLDGGNGKNLDTLMLPQSFKKKLADKITNYDSSVDVLEIDADSFGIDDSATFASGNNTKAVKKLAKQDFDFLYDQKKGGLYFNENGADKGFGEGGIIAILKGAPELTSGNLEFT